MKNVFALALLAGTAVSATSVFAQESGPLPIREVRRDPIGHPGGGYTSRAIDTVYDCLTATFGNGSATHLGTSSMILEDISFAPGPWGTAAGTGAPHIMTEITYGVAVITTPTGTEDFLLIFWDKDDINFQGWTGNGSNMINPAAAPIAVLRVDLAGLQAGFYWQVTSALTGFPGGGVTVPSTDNGVALQAAWVNDGFTPTAYQDLGAGIFAGCTSNTDRSTVFGSQSGAPQGGNAASPGSTSISYGRDISNATMCPDIGRFIGNGGAPVGAGNIEHRTIAAAPQRGYMVRLKGDVVVPPPPSTPLGCIADAGLTQAGSVAANGVVWYNFCLNSAADDASLHFLDVDTETSAGDVFIAVYNNGGSLAGGFADAKDDDSGSGTNAQLSFGVGRRAAIADGSQYDGRTGQLAAGTYYIAVAPAGSSAGAGFTVSASANAGGTFNLNFATNTNGAALAASVIPLINGVDYGSIDPTLADVRPGTGQASGLRGVLWSHFNLATPADATHFLDGDMKALSTANADSVAYIFNGNAGPTRGDIMYFSDDEGPDALSQFSLGAAGSRIYGANIVPFDGNTPVGGSAGLGAGDYYMATALFATQDLSALISGHRFHVRGTSGSNLTLGMDMYSGSTGSNFCCLDDYNGDGDVGTDADIEAFFACLSGNCCATCPPDADFNCDGDVGTDGDIEAFFRVLAGGAC